MQKKILAPSDSLMTPLDTISGGHQKRKSIKCNSMNSKPYRNYPQPQIHTSYVGRCKHKAAYSVQFCSIHYQQCKIKGKVENLYIFYVLPYSMYGSHTLYCTQSLQPHSLHIYKLKSVITVMFHFIQFIRL